MGGMSASGGLHVSELRFAYSGGALRLHVPQLQIDAGGTLALSGPSGAGKSTLMRLLAGLLRPASGEVRLAEVPINTLTHEQCRAFRLKRIGLVFQDFALLDYLTVEENILLPHQLGRTVGTRVLRERAHALVNRLQIDAYFAQRVSQLSQGERQRVAVARALVHEPEFIFADEPTASLDPARGRVVVDLLLEEARQRGACLMMVTHDPGLPPLFSQTARMEDFSQGS